MNRRMFIRNGVGLAGVSVMARAAFGQDEGEAGDSKHTIRIALSAITVNDQTKAEAFYTEKLGFQKKQDIPMGPMRYMTFVAPSEPDGTELSLEPLGFPPSKVYQEALYDAGIPATAFEVDDVDASYEHLVGLGVEFSMKPTKMMNVRMVILDDTCGNRIQLYQVVA